MIEIDRTWALEADDCNIILLRKRTPKKGGVPHWISHGFFPSIHDALRELVLQEVRSTQLTSLALLNQRIDDLFVLISHLPNIEVKDLMKPKKVLSPEHIAKLHASRRKKTT